MNILTVHSLLIIIQGEQNCHSDVQGDDLCDLLNDTPKCAFDGGDCFKSEATGIKSVLE